MSRLNRNLTSLSSNSLTVDESLNDHQENDSDTSLQMPNVSANFDLPKHSYYTRSAAKRQSVAIQNSSNHLSLIEPQITRTNGFSYTKYQLIPRIIPMDHTPCAESNSKYKLFLLAVFFVILGITAGFLIYNFQDMKTDLHDIKDKMEQIKYDECAIKGKQATNQKLEIIQNHLEEIKKSQYKCSEEPPPEPMAPSQSGGAFQVDNKVNREVYEIIRQALDEYSADRTGKTDFALEASGGSIISTGQTIPFEPNSAKTLFGISICPQKNGPRALIQATYLPGECWAFKGSTGSVVIKLLGPVFIDGVSLEHISKAISPTGILDTAPKEFSIWGVPYGSDEENMFLGKFTYEINMSPLQFFGIECSSSEPKSYDYIEFKIHSNHGNPDFTCVYRLRVHGTLDKAKL